METVYELAGKTVTLEELQSKFNLPQNAVVEGCHAYATDSDELIQIKRFVWQLQMLQFDGFGSSAFKKLYTLERLRDCTIAQVFSVTKEELKLVGFGPTEQVNFMSELFRIKRTGVKLTRIVRALAIDGCGTAIAKQWARKLSGLSADWSGLTKEVVNEVERRLSEIIKSMDMLDGYGVIIIKEKDDVVDAESVVKYLLTGSPKSFGFSTKEQFKSTLPQNWQEVGNIKLADMLITDSLISKSSKMSAATKLGKQIVTYQGAIDLAKPQTV